jgi:3-oxoacyl-[acyl-carrier protein] reductase
VNNAGIGHERPPAATHDLDIEVLVRPQLLSPVVLTKSIVRHMLADG